MRRLLTILTAFTVFTAPAFAQSFCACDGTGNVLVFANKSAAIQSGKIAARQTGLDSFAMAPRPERGLNSDGRAGTGGGSPGYNEMLRNY
ncbi:MAG TPA: hypothetical protein VEC94_08740 [Pseudolabrys sp.]|nr:hypothetical protein [Pseudolabrys sp.]